MPEQRFAFVESWWDTAADFAAYPNVTYVPRVHDMASLYRSHRVLLVPSTVEEAFPRVIVEAAFHGARASAPTGRHPRSHRRHWDRHTSRRGGGGAERFQREEALELLEGRSADLFGR
ncbi:hypothetical protein ABZV60_16735 [Streptomyces sp. NPDC004787]|uniref:hypothetical protein n=1 Tax=Streptomyces sp. NPDC004787 TaxID=3154291 RepID=UPI0033A78A99